MADKKVVIYTTPTCPWCHRAKEYLARKEISYIEHNLVEEMDITFALMQESGRDVTRKMLQKGGQTAVPVITIDDEVVVGFNQSLLDSLLS